MKERKFPCDDCTSTFTHKDRLERHVKCVHLKTKPFKCNQSEASYARNSNLKKCVSNSHEKLKPIKCGKCELSFAEGSEHLNKHLLSMHENTFHLEMKPFKCTKFNNISKCK